MITSILIVCKQALNMKEHGKGNFKYRYRLHNAIHNSQEFQK